MARTAEVVFVGDAQSLIRASQQAAAASEAATAKIEGANAKIGTSATAANAKVEAANARAGGSYFSMSGAAHKAAAELEGSHNKMVSSLAGIGHSSNIAIAGLVGLGAAAYGVKKAVDTTAELAKETLLLHNVTGLSTQSASAYAGVAQVQGLNTKQLNMAFGTLSKNVQAVTNAHEGLTKAASKQELAFRQLGLPMAAITKAHGDMNKLLPQITKRFEEMPGGIEKTNLGMTLFARGWQTLVPLMHTGTLGLTEQLKVAKEMGVELSGNTAQQQKQYIQAQEKMKYATLGLQIAVTEFLAPALVKLVRTVADVVNEIRKMPEPLKIALEAVLGLGAGLTGLVVATKSITAVGTALKVLKGVFVSTAAADVAANATMVGSTEAAAVAMKGSLMTTGIGAVLVLLGTAAYHFRDKWGAVMDEVKKATETAAEAVVTALNKVKKALEIAAEGPLALRRLIPGLGGDVVPNIPGVGAGRSAEEATARSGGGGRQAAKGEYPVEGKYGAIEAAARKYHIDPSVLWGIYGTETDFGKNISTSSAGAMGAFQFIPGTAKEYGYPMTNRPSAGQFAQQADAAARYLEHLIHTLGSVDAALAAYSGHTAGYAQKVSEHAAAGGGNLGYYESAAHKAAKHKVAAEGYVDPFASATGVSRSRTDQGVDFTFGGGLGAIGPGIVEKIANFQGFGQTVVYRLTSGPHKGQRVYVGLETGGRATVHGGESVRAGQQIAQGFGTGGIEMGFAGPEGLPITRYAAGQSHEVPTAGGEAFSKFLASIGKGGSNLQLATAQFGEVAKRAAAAIAHLILSPKQERAVGGLLGSAAEAHGEAAMYEGYATEASQAWERTRPRQEQKRKPLDTARGAGEQTAIDQQDILTAQARKKYYERAVVAKQKEAKERAKLRDSYLKFARHAKGHAQKEAMNKAAHFDGEVKNLQAEAKALDGTIADTESQIEAAQEVLSVALPGEVQAADLGAYQAAVGKVDLEQRAELITPEQAQAAKKVLAEKALGGGFGALSGDALLQVKGDLVEFGKALQSNTSALEAHDAALKEVTKSLNAFNQASSNLKSVELASLTKSLADLVSGEIAGNKYLPRVSVPGAGSAARY